MNRSSASATLLLSVLCGACRDVEPRALAPAAPPFARPATEDALIFERLKKTGSLLSWRGDEQRVGYANIEKLTRVNIVRNGAQVFPLEAAPRDLSAFRYSYKGVAGTIDDFMSRLNVVGLLVIIDGQIVLERYAKGNTRETRWTSFSVAKSVTSLLYGAAVKDGSIKDLNDPVVQYVPAAAGGAYDGVTLRQLLQMSSGVAWSEDSSRPDSDISQLSRLNREGGWNAQLAYLSKRPRVSPAGKRFNYNTAETDLAGAALRAAVGRTLSDYLSEKIWQPFGMESAAFWITMRNSDLERGGCCISATLRDYGRIGLFALRDGIAQDGTRLLPDGWVRESTRPSPASRGYGYYWWLRRNGRYFASGMFGQHIEVAPADRTVVAIQSYWPAPVADELIDHNDTFVHALIEEARRRPSEPAKQRPPVR